MPTADQIAKAAERREARRQAREESASNAQSDLQELSRKTEQQNAERDAAAKTGTAAARPAPTRKTRAQITAERREQARRQAEIDVRREVPEIDVRRHLTPGRTPPLHVLNKMAKDASKAIKDDANAIAQAAARGAYAEATGRRAARGSDYASRHQKVRDAQALAAAANAEKK